MVEEQEFLKIEELTTQSHDFKKKWYGLEGKTETLTKFKQGFDEGFKKAVKEIYDDVDSCKNYVDVFEHSLKQYFPEQRSDITWMTKKVFRHLEDLRVLVKKDYEVLEASKDLSEKLKNLNTEFMKAEVKLKDAETKSGDACRKYFDMKNEFAAEQKLIDDKVKKDLEKVRGKFIEMTTPIVEGHDIALATRSVSISELFEHLTEKPEDVEKINLVVKRGVIFGKKAETDIAKTSVLKYVSGEILEGVPPLMKEKKRLIEKLKSDYAELPRLEKECEESEKQRKKIETPVEDLREKIAEMKKSEVFKFADYDGILETREQYLDKIKESEKDIKDYLDFALIHLKGFVELESDVEKRNLLTELKEMKERVSAMEKETAKAREDLSSKIQELTSATAAKEELETELATTVELKEASEKEIADVKRRMEGVTKKAQEFEKTVLPTLQKFESEIKSKLTEISSAAAASGKRGAEEQKVEKKLETLRGKKK